MKLLIVAAIALAAAVAAASPEPRGACLTHPAPHGSKWIRRKRRLAIYARDGWCCVWCLCRGADTKPLP